LPKGLGRFSKVRSYSDESVNVAIVEGLKTHLYFLRERISTLAETYNYKGNIFYNLKIIYKYKKRRWSRGMTWAFQPNFLEKSLIKKKRRGKIAHCPGSNPGRRINPFLLEKEPEECLSAVDIRIFSNPLPPSYSFIDSIFYIYEPNFKLWEGFFNPFLSNTMYLCTLR
jgi:hypothetical protein